MAAALLDGFQGLIDARPFADIVQQPVAWGFGADVGHSQPALSDQRPGTVRQIKQRVRAREAPPGQLELRQNLEQRDHVDLTVEEIMIVEIYRVDTILGSEELEIPFQPLGWRKRRLAAKHGRHAAKGAAE